MVQPSASPLFESFMDNTQVHREIARDIARTKKSIANTVARTTQTIAESRALLEKMSRIADKR